MEISDDAVWSVLNEIRDSTVCNRTKLNALEDGINGVHKLIIKMEKCHRADILKLEKRMKKVDGGGPVGERTWKELSKTYGKVITLILMLGYITYDIMEKMKLLDIVMRIQGWWK